MNKDIKNIFPRKHFFAEQLLLNLCYKTHLKMKTITTKRKTTRKTTGLNSAFSEKKTN